MDNLDVFLKVFEQQKNPLICAVLTRAYWHSMGDPVEGESSVPELFALRAKAQQNRNRRNRRMRDQVRRDCGLVKVRGALGGIYWE